MAADNDESRRALECAGGAAEMLLGAFDGLQADTALELTADEDLRPLLDRLRAERPGLVEWFLVENSPSRIRVHVQRCPDPGPRQVSEFLGRDQTASMRCSQQSSGAADATT